MNSTFFVWPERERENCIICPVISIENLLFGSDNLTDENNLIVFRNVQKYIHHSNRFE
jgi:hypothetical protein